MGIYSSSPITIPSPSTYSYWQVYAQNSPCPVAATPTNTVHILPQSVSSGSVTISDNTTILPPTLNITNGDFTVTSGYTVTLPQGCPVTITANNITIAGTVNGVGMGTAGGAGGAPGNTGGGGTCGSPTANSPGGTGGTSGAGSTGGAGGGNGQNGTETCNQCIFGITLNNVIGAGGGGAGQGGGNGGNGGTAGAQPTPWNSSMAGAGGGTNLTVGGSIAGFGVYACPR